MLLSLSLSDVIHYTEKWHYQKFKLAVMNISNLWNQQLKRVAGLSGWCWPVCQCGYVPWEVPNPVPLDVFLSCIQHEDLCWAVPVKYLGWKHEGFKLGDWANVKRERMGRGQSYLIVPIPRGLPCKVLRTAGKTDLYIMDFWTLTSLWFQYNLLLVGLMMFTIPGYSRHLPK